MPIAANFLDILILLGAIQGLIVSFLLFRSAKVRKANRFLAGILTLLSLACLNLFLLQTNVGFDAIWWDILAAVVPLVIIMPVGPLIYFYLRGLLQPELPFTKTDRSHFYTVILDFIPSILTIVYILIVLFQWMDTQQAAILNSWIDHAHRYLDAPRWLAISYYLWLSWQLIKRFDKVPVSVKKWPKQMVLGFTIFQVIWLLHLIPYLLPQTYQYLLQTFSWYPVYIPIVILVYWLGVKGYLINHDLPLKNSSRPKSPLESVLAEKIIQQLNHSMREDQLFLNPNLNLKILVAHTNINQKQISAALNQHLGKNFNEYVNTYRITEAQQRLLDPNYEDLTVAAIAYDCGFNSLATFQRTFKKLTGQTPKAFQQEMQQKE